MDEERLLTYHRFTREHGVNRPLYWLARLLLVPFFLIYFRLARIGREHGRVNGPLIVVANHRSFLDPFVIGASLPWRRPLHYVAKVELFEKRWQGWILNRLGAYPVRRGQSDDQTLITSRRGPRARRRDLHLPGGDAPPNRLARQAQARFRPPRAGDRGRRSAGRRPRHRAGAARLEDPPEEGQGSDGARAHLPADRGPLAGAGELRRRAGLARDRAAVGVARRTATAPQGGRDRRRQLGNGRRRAARSRRARRAARHPDRRARRGDERDPHERELPARASSSRSRSRSSEPPRSSSPGSIWSAWRSPRPPFRRQSARSATASVSEHRFCCSARGWSLRWPRCPPSTSLSASALGQSPRSAAPRTRRRPCRVPQLSCSAVATRICGTSSGASSTRQAWSASAPRT